MTKTGAVPSLFFTVGTFTFTLAFAPVAWAQAPAAKPAAPAAASPKPAAPPAGAATKPAAAAAAAPATPPAAPEMPAPSKELEAFMKGFEGSWKCDTKFAAGPASPESTTKTTVKIKKEFDGFSWHGEFKLAKTAAMPAMSGVFQVGYDPSTKQATYLSYDSMGSAMMGAGPISGDSATFTEEGYMMGKKTKVRETMSKKGSKEIAHKLEVDQGKGYQLLVEDTCKK